MTKLKQQVMPTYCHIDNTDVIENDIIFNTPKKYINFTRCMLAAVLLWTRCIIFEANPSVLKLMLLFITKEVKPFTLKQNLSPQNKTFSFTFL
jgi:hypothetical protein